MKTKFTILILSLLMSYNSYSQNTEVYNTVMLEFPITWANANDNGAEVTGPVRFAPFLNFTNNLNFDFSEKVGFQAGVSLRNLGFIYDVDASTRIKARSYNIGIPIGFKFGNMNKAFFYAGYEVEFPVNFKEKTFVNEEKTKYNKWFSDQVPIQQSITAGVQLPYGANIKFKYYFTNFFNKDFDGTDSNGNATKPYENFDVNVFYVSLNVYLLRNTEFYYTSN